jgi:uncharacterized protein YkwD
MLIPAIAQSPRDPVVAPYVTRAEAVTIMLFARAPNIPKVPNEGLYRDLPAGAWYEKPMLAGARLGIVEADAVTKELRPNELLNRAELLKMLSRAFELEQAEGNFQDVAPESWYARYAGLARRYRLFPEDNDMLDLHPDKLVTFHETMLAAQAVLKTSLDAAPRENLITRVEKIGGKVLLVVSSGETIVYVDEPLDQSSLPSPDEIYPSRDALKTEVLREVNSIRTKLGIRPLTYNEKLDGSAQRYAEDMASRGFFSHVSPTGETLKDRMIESGYYNRGFSLECLCVRGFAIAENLARGQKTPLAAFDAWMNSPRHRAALLSGDYTETGLGVVEKASVWVQHFGGIILPGQQEIIGGGL